jgi:hypothetical protein
MNLFSMPSISEIARPASVVRAINQNLDIDVEMIEEEEEKRGMSIVETEKLRKFATTFNFTQQELQHGY